MKRSTMSPAQRAAADATVAAALASLQANLRAALGRLGDDRGARTGETRQ